MRLPFALIIAFVTIALLGPAAAQMSHSVASPQLSASDARKSREAALAYLAQELAKVQADRNVAMAQNQHASAADWAKRINEWLRQMAALRDAFSDNPYIRITGFSVNIPLGIGVNIDFKQ